MFARRMTTLLTIVANLTVAASCSGASVPLHDGLAHAAQQVVAFITDAGYGTVGVLKFRVHKPRASGETVGTINRDVTSQLETALVLERKKPATFLLVADASDPAAAIPGAGDDTEAGREKLFAGRYRPAWGDQQTTVAVDAFITGTIDVDEAFESMRVAIIAVDRAGRRQDICGFDAIVEPALLVPLGESFTTRGMLNAGLPRIPRQESGESVKPPVPAKPQGFTPESKHPLDGTDTPAVLSVTYDGADVPLEFRDGRAFLREPREGQKVTLTVRKRNRDGRRIGVVLKVNGENTAMRERAPDLQCYKWILSDQIPTVIVRGYQADRERIQPFTVLSAAASRSRAFDYGADVGTITVTVFDDEASLRPQVAPPTQVAGRPDPLAVTMIERGVRLDSVPVPPTPQQLRESLYRNGPSLSRGLISEGDTTEKRSLDLVEFRPVPTPVMAAVVTYYDPGAKSAE